MTRLAIFGATGRAGSELLSQAIDAGHDVRALVRNPSKLESQAAGLTVLQGDVASFMLHCLTDDAYVRQAPMVRS
jgi:putative NADH-flavin reductase